MAGDHPATEPMSKAEAAKWHGGGHGGKIPYAESLAAYPPSNQLTRPKQLSKTRLVAIGWLVRAAGELEDEHSRLGSGHVGHWRYRIQD